MSKRQNKRLNIGIGKKNDNIETPIELYEVLNDEFNFNFDPCPINHNFDGLLVKWRKCNYVNPPYSQIPKWIIKGIEEMKQGNKSVFLIPVRTNSKYFLELILPYASEIRFITQKIKFKGFNKGFPMGLYLIIFDPNKLNKLKIKKEKNEFIFCIFKIRN